MALRASASGRADSFQRVSARQAHPARAAILRQFMPGRAGMSGATNTSALSVWSPLTNRLFRAIWIAGLVSNVGSWMHLVAAQWEMTSLSRSPGEVALIATAGALPAFILALPAGALADVVD